MIANWLKLASLSQKTCTIYTFSYLVNYLLPKYNLFLRPYFTDVDKRCELSPQTGFVHAKLLLEHRMGVRGGDRKLIPRITV